MVLRSARKLIRGINFSEEGHGSGSAAIRNQLMLLRRSRSGQHQKLLHLQLRHILASIPAVWQTLFLKRNKIKSERHMIRAIILFALLPLFSAAHATTPGSKPLFELAVDYTKLKRIPVCYRDAEGALYPRCYKAEDAYNAALTRAKAENKPLMIIWGFDECSACRFLESREFNPAEPWMTDRFATWALSEKQAASLGNNGNDLEILLLRINSRSPSGQALSKKLGVYKIARDRGGRRVWSPFITMTNPVTGQLVTQTSMRANQQPCNRWDEYALNLEDLGYIPSDDSYERRIC